MIAHAVAFNEGDNPEPMPWAEYFVCGPNTTAEQAQAIRAAGSKLIVKVQPVRVLKSDGSPDMYWPWGRSLSLIPLLRMPDGTFGTLDAPGQGMEGRYVLDFGASTVPLQMGKLVNHLCASLGAIGVMQDYGGISVQNMSPSLSQPYNWAPWAAGYMSYRQYLLNQKRRLWNCNNAQSVPGATLCIEGIRLNGSDTTYPPNPTQAYNLGLANPDSIMLVEYPDDTLRQQVVAKALACGGNVDWRPAFFTGDRVSREPAPELL